tara:strand:- start:81549 stop:82619 length:1071 start_codon:yes stop_codon:yes gene_type:complete
MKMKIIPIGLLLLLHITTSLAAVDYFVGANQVIGTLKSPSESSTATLTNTANSGQLNTINLSNNKTGIDFHGGATFFPEGKFHVSTSAQFLWLFDSSQQFDTPIHYAIPSSLTSNSLNTQLETYSLFFNVQPEYEFVQGWKLFAKVGLGLADNSTDTNFTLNQITEHQSVNNINFAWQAGIGMAVAITPHWQFSVSENYMNFGQSHYGDHYFAGTNAPSGFNLQSKNTYAYMFTIGFDYLFKSEPSSTSQTTTLHAGSTTASKVTVNPVLPPSTPAKPPTSPIKASATTAITTPASVITPQTTTIGKHDYHKKHIAETGCGLSLKPRKLNGDKTNPPCVKSHKPRTLGKKTTPPQH